MKFTEGDMMRALRIADDSWGTAHLEAAAQLIADVREEERAKLAERIRELTEGLEAHDLHIGMASKARDAAIRGGRYAWLRELVEGVRSEERERCARTCDRFAEMMYDSMVGEPRMGRGAEECAERIRSGS